MELKVTQERVLEAAKGCPDAQRVLQALFPEAFKAEHTNLELRFDNLKVASACNSNMLVAEIRGSSNPEYHHRALYVPNSIKASIEKDGTTTVIVFRKA